MTNIWQDLGSIIEAGANYRTIGISLASRASYETLKLRGYIAIFDISKNVKVVLYANGAVIPKENGDTETFITLKNDLLRAIKSCEIVKA